MKFYTINDYKLSMECLTSWSGRSLESIERVGPAKAELIKKAFLHFFWLIWLCENYPEETENFLTELKDPKGIATSGLFPVRYKLGEAIASNIIRRFGPSGSYSNCGRKPPKQLIEMVGVSEEDTSEKRISK